MSKCAEYVVRFRELLVMSFCNRLALGVAPHRQYNIVVNIL